MYVAIVCSGLLTLIQFSSVAAVDCTWNVQTSLPSNQPLYINPSSPHRDVLGFFLPDITGTVTIPSGQLVTFFCSNGKLNTFLTTSTTLQCIGGSSFKTPGTNNQYSFSSISCTSSPNRGLVKEVASSCSNNVAGATLHRVGYQATAQDFYYNYEFCFYNATNDALYSHFRLTNSIKGKQTNAPSLDFLGLKAYYPTYIANVDDLYTQVNQVDTITNILNSLTLAQSVVVPNTNYYLARGHLAADAYFVYGSQQRATYWFMNAVPQFSNANSANWKTLETQVRKFAGNSTKILDIFVGSSDNLKHVDTVNALQNLSLYYNDTISGNNRIRVPKLIWKIMYDAQLSQGVAFIMLNTGDEPVTGTPLSGVCADVCASLPWLSWPNRTIFQYGYGVCCSVDDARDSIPEMPTNLSVTGGLIVSM